MKADTPTAAVCGILAAVAGMVRTRSFTGSFVLLLVLTVRATDGEGEVQTSETAAPFPSGATGWHSIAVTVN